MYLTPAKNPTKNELQILFPRKARAAPEKRGVVADMKLEVNKAPCITNVPAHIWIYRQLYNEKGKLSALMETVATRSIVLPLHSELLLRVERKYDPKSIDITGDQRWHGLPVHWVAHERYRQQLNGMEMIQEEIEGGQNNVQLAWTLTWLSSSTGMECIRADKEKQNASTKVMVVKILVFR